MAGSGTAGSLDDALARLRGFVDRAARSLAASALPPTAGSGGAPRSHVAGGAAAAGGVPLRLDAAVLDRHQPIAFELAWASAELLAAEAARAAGARFADLFAADAAVSIVGRLEAIFLELDAAALAELQALAASAGWSALRRAHAGEAALAAAGRDFVASDGDVGDPPLPEPVAMARDTFRRFGADVVAPEAEAIHRQDRTVPESVLRPLREMGVFGLSIPERYGGLARDAGEGGPAPDEGHDLMTMLVVTEALSEASLAAAGSLMTRPEILCRALLAGGSEAQKERWLPRIAAGDPLCAIAITEPDHGSDVAGLTLKATRVEAGWRLDGAKTWCTLAGKAGLVMVVARTDPDRSLGHRGLSIFLVEKPAFEGHAFEHASPLGGRLAGRAIPTLGYRGMHSFDLAFEGFVVADDALVGGEAGLGRGFYLTMTGMMGGRLQTAARASGVMRAAIGAAFRHATDRRVFGVPLVEQPLARAKLVRMAARFAACRALAYRVAASMQRDESSPAARRDASLVKLIACRSAELVTREALQLHGGMGYAEESAVSRWFVDARVLSIFEGAEETLALKVIARGLVEEAAESDAARAASSRPA